MMTGSQFRISFLVLFVSFTLGQWSLPVALTNSQGNSKQNENIGRTVIANDTFVHVVWFDYLADGIAAYYRRSDDTGLTWNNPVRLSPTPGNDSFVVAAISGSYIHVAYIRNLNYDNANTAPSIYKRSRDNGNSWDEDVNLGGYKFWPGISATGPYVYVSLNGAVNASNTEVYFRRSSNFGDTWDSVFRISNADGRSEDPCIHSYGTGVYIVWNDNRNGGTMELYYRRSLDNGATWGPETALTKVPSNTYTPTVFASGPTSVAIGYSDRGATSHNRIQTILSNDQGATFGPPFDHSAPDSTCTEVYPSIVQDKLNIHLTWFTLCSGSTQTIYYRLSKDGGQTWSQTLNLVTNSANGVPSAPFISVFGPIAHVTFDFTLNAKGQVYYLRNPTGNPTVTPPEKIPTSVVLTTHTNLARKYLPLHRGLTVIVQLANGSIPFPVPTGNISFFHNTTTSKTWVKIPGSPVTLDATGSATITLLGLDGFNGPLGIKAQYTGDSVYASSTLFVSVFFYLFPQDGVYLVKNSLVGNGKQVTYSGSNWNTVNGFTQNITLRGWTPRRNSPLPMVCGEKFNVEVNAPPPANPPALYIGVVGVNFIKKESPHQSLSQKIVVVQTGVDVQPGIGKVLASFCSAEN